MGGNRPGLADCSAMAWAMGTFRANRVAAVSSVTAATGAMFAAISSDAPATLLTLFVTNLNPICYNTQGLT